MIEILQIKYISGIIGFLLLITILYISNSSRFKGFKFKKKKLENDEDISKNQTSIKIKKQEFKCKCGKTFDNNSDLTSHKKICPNKCSCGKIFSNSLMLKVHQNGRSAYTKIDKKSNNFKTTPYVSLPKEFKCKCGKKFYTNSDLTSHKKICPNKCSCGKIFSNSLMLKVHQNECETNKISSPRNEPVIMHECKCGKSFETERILKNHKKFYCELRCKCGRYFDTTRGLKTHIRSCELIKKEKREKEKNSIEIKTFKPVREIENDYKNTVESTNNFGEIIPTRKFKDGFDYHYFYAYYPTKFEVQNKFNERRIKIWEFKEGKNSIDIALMMKSNLQILNLSGSLDTWHLCIIPASTSEKTNIRFRSFCSEFCRNSSVNNGFEIIQQTSDRVAVHLQENRGDINILDYLQIGNVSGEKILLVDDIYTTGSSFIKVANKLRSNGAIEVVGLFLGKTHWKD